MDDESIKKIMSLTLKQLYRSDFLRYKYNREYIKKLLEIIESEMNSKQLKEFYAVFKPIIEEELNSITES